MWLDIDYDDILTIYENATDSNIKYFFSFINGDYILNEKIFQFLESYFDFGAFSGDMDIIDMIKNGEIHLSNGDFQKLNDDYPYVSSIKKIDDNLFLIIE